jgi:ORF6N domain
MSSQAIIPQEIIEKRILLIHGQKVMLDKDLAELYQVETYNLNKAVKRNRERFPNDFMFPLTEEEFKNLIFHFGISRWGGTRKLPNAFTEQGVAMLSSVLRSPRAVQVNIEIMRAFVKLRQIVASNKELAQKLEELEKKYDTQFKIVFDAIREIMQPPEKPKRRIGFDVDEPQFAYKTSTKT